MTKEKRNITSLKNVKVIYDFDGEFAMYETTDEHCGIINRKGEVLLDADEYEYDQICRIDDKWFALGVGAHPDKPYQSDRWNAYTGAIMHRHILNMEGKYDIEIVNYQNGAFKMGIVDKHFNPQTPIQYTGLIAWNDDKYMAKLDDKWGVITPQGQVIVPFQYDDCMQCTGRNRFTNTQSVAKDGEYFYINAHGERLTQRPYEYLEPLNCFSLAIMKLNGCFGLIDRDENIVLMTDVVGDNPAMVNERCFYWCGYNRLAFRQNGLLGIMDSTGKVIVQPAYTSIRTWFKLANQVTIVKDEQDFEGSLSLDGDVIIPCGQYRHVAYYRELHTYRVRDLNGKWGLLDTKGQEVVPTIYDALHIGNTYGLNEIAVKLNGRCYFINSKQEEVKVF